MFFKTAKHSNSMCILQSLCATSNLFNPRQIFLDSGVDSGRVQVGAIESAAHDADEEGRRIFVADNVPQRTAGITDARVRSPDPLFRFRKSFRLPRSLETRPVAVGLDVSHVPCVKKLQTIIFVEMLSGVERV